MNPLETNKKVLIWLCLCPAEKSTKWTRKLIYIIFALIILTGNLCAFGTSVAYFLRYVSTDLEGSLYALYQIGAFYALIYMTITAFYLRQEILALFDSLTKIYEKCKRFLLSKSNTSLKCFFKTHFYDKLILILSNS